MAEDKHKGQRLNIRVPDGKRDALDKIAKERGFKNYVKYVLAVLENDSGLDLTSVEKGNPNLRKYGKLKPPS